MKYVKLTAKPNTWFKEGTECFYEDKNIGERLSLEEWEEVKKGWGITEDYSKGIIGMQGLRMNQCKYELDLFKDSERWDGEVCGLCEFFIEIVEEEK